MTGQAGVPNVSSVLLALLLCGFLGFIGQGVRAIVGLKNAGSLNSTTPSEQAVFSLAYLALSLMIGFVAGVLAGLALGLQDIIAIDPGNWKLLLGIVGSGYIGADFVENTMSLVIPGRRPAAEAKPTPPPAPINVSPPAPVSVSPRAPSTAPAPEPEGGAALRAAMQSVCPEANTGVWVPALVAALAKFDFSNNRRRAAAMGQFLVEAGPALASTVEDLDYSPDRACQVFPALFPTPASAEFYCADQRRFADHVYAGVNGNGDEASGDGYRFRGRGLIQLTGRDEYAAFGRAIGMTAEQAAALCETPDGAASSGSWYLASNGCLPLADEWDIDAITRRVNGDAMEAAGLRRQYADEMVSRLREYAAP
jgi:predicted chitinase